MSWLTPLGLPVMQPYRTEATYEIPTVLQKVSLVVSHDSLPVSPRKQKTAFPPNFVHSLDSTHMILTSLKMKEMGLTFAAVHDSYWTHPSDVPIMSKVS
jgi:DNA-directed RNA polymerase